MWTLSHWGFSCLTLIIDEPALVFYNHETFTFTRLQLLFVDILLFNVTDYVESVFNFLITQQYIRLKRCFLCTVHVASTLILPAMHCLSLHWSQTAAINTPADFLSPAELPYSSLALAAVWFVAFNCLFLSSFTV